jgi:predicted O-methyltransferase YrrM
MPGVDFDLARQLAWLENDLAPYIAEFPYPREQPAEGGFYLDNGNYETVDAETLWAIVRHLKPERIIELGSGYSTLVMAGAVEANREEGHTTELRTFDPYARDFVKGAVPQSALDVPLERFDELQSGDVLFVDTTHTVKTGSEVNRIVLEVLPRLAPGVHVHFHDIFLPYEYPREYLADQWWFWAEQYLLQAFLACNDHFEVTLATNALATDHADRVAAVVPSFTPGIQPGAFWIRRCD